MTYPWEGDSHWKRWVIPYNVTCLEAGDERSDPPGDGPAAYQVVGGVMAYQAYDG